MSKIVSYAVIAIAGLSIVVCISYVVLDSTRSRKNIRHLEVATERSVTALEKAKTALREKIRLELKKEDAKRSEKAVVAGKERSKKLRTAVRRKFFGGDSGFTMSRAYWKSTEMPKGDPVAADQEIIDLAGESASEEDLDTAAEVTEAALKSEDPRARLAAVEMLSALGKVGLADLCEFLTDEHPEVANLAADRYELEVQNVVNDADRTELVKIGLLAISDEDKLQSMVGTLQMTSDELLIIQVVADVMREGSKAQRAAVREAYEGTTGEPWTGEAAAEKWLKENYEPPPESEEPDEESDNNEGNGENA